MVPTLFFYQLVLVALVWLCVMLQWAWPSDPATCPPPSEPTPPEPKRHREPTPFAGLTTKPHCDTCEHGTAPRPQAPSTPPPRIVPTRGRRRQVDTSTHFCPNPDCAYRGWVGWGNLRANGHPSGGPWRQLLCVVCRRLFSRDPRHDLPWQARLCRAHRARHRVPGRRPGHPGHGAGVRGRPAIRCCSGWWRRRSSCGPSHSTSCTTCGSGRCNSMNSLPCSARSRTARSARLRPSSAWSGRPSGSGWRWTPRASCCWRSTSAIAPSRWRNALSTTSRRSWPPTAPRCFSPMGLGSI